MALPCQVYSVGYRSVCTAHCSTERQTLRLWSGYRDALPEAQGAEGSIWVVASVQGMNPTNTVTAQLVLQHVIASTRWTKVVL